MCIPCCNTQNDMCGIGDFFNGAASIAIIGGITAVVAAFAAAYFDSGTFATTALTTTAVIAAGVSLIGVVMIFELFSAVASGFSR